MRNFRRGFVYATVVSLVLGLASSISPKQSHFGTGGWEAQKQQVEFGSRASEIIGKKVYFARGDRLGRVRDLVIDTDNGELKYFIISSGGFAGIGSHHKLVPPGAISLATIREDAVSLNVTPERWRGAPDFAKAVIANMDDPAQEQQIYAYYRQPLPALAGPASIPASAPQRMHSRQAGGLRLGSDIIGEQVENSQGRVLGKILDLLVELKDPKRTLAIFKPATFLAKTEKLPAAQLFLVAVNDLKPHGETSRMALEVSPDEFQTAQALDTWIKPGATKGDPKVYRYPLESIDDANLFAPNNTGRNVRDRRAGALTPLQQSGSAEDLHLTRSIRRALVNNDKLSLGAKNVKVISGSGRVVLRGPVRSEQERKEIGQLAENVAGVRNVENNLEIARK